MIYNSHSLLVTHLWVHSMPLQCPELEGKLCLDIPFPVSPLKATSWNPSWILHRVGLLTACLFWLPGQKGLGSKNMTGSTATPCCYFPRPRSISQTAVGSCSQEVAPTEATGVGGSISAEYMLAFSTDFPHFLWGFGKWKQGGQGRPLSRHLGMPPTSH